MNTKDNIFLESKAWVKEKLSLDKDYFNRLSTMHTPGILWIGSTDNLISVREMTNTEPGEILVYRNMASQVREDDISMMAMVEEAVDIYHVRYIIVCAYSHCSGIRRVLTEEDNHPAVEHWLKPLRNIYDQHRGELKNLDITQKEKYLSERNVCVQIENLSRLKCIQKAWERTDYPILYGWYFDLESGLLKEICAMEKNHKMKQVASVL